MSRSVAHALFSIELLRLATKNSRIFGDARVVCTGNTQQLNTILWISLMALYMQFKETFQNNAYSRLISFTSIHLQCVFRTKGIFVNSVRGREYFSRAREICSSYSRELSCGYYTLEKRYEHESTREGIQMWS